MATFEWEFGFLEEFLTSLFIYVLWRLKISTKKLNFLVDIWYIRPVEYFDWLDHQMGAVRFLNAT